MSRLGDGADKQPHRNLCALARFEILGLREEQPLHAPNALRPDSRCRKHPRVRDGLELDDVSAAIRKHHDVLLLDRTLAYGLRRHGEFDLAIEASSKRLPLRHINNGAKVSYGNRCPI